MTSLEIREVIEERYDGIVTADGFDDAIIGVAERACKESVIVYDYEWCVQVLMRDSEMDDEAAREFLNFNTVDAHVGDRTPVFLHRWREGDYMPPLGGYSQQQQQPGRQNPQQGIPPQPPSPAPPSPSPSDKQR